jgi:hypothetical protein
MHTKLEIRVMLLCSVASEDLAVNVSSVEVVFHFSTAKSSGTATNA